MTSLLDGRLKLRHLLLVDALTEQGSVVGAASALHITQPVATRGLHDLESILGVTLYERGPRGITPTEFGEEFTRHARAVIAQIGQAERHIGELAGASRGAVVVGTHLAGSSLLLPHAIVRLKARHPGLRITVREGTPGALLAELTAGRIDMVLGRLTGPRPEGTRRHVLCQDTIRLVVGSHHPLAGRRKVSPAELQDLPWVLPGSETSLRQELEDYFLLHGLEVPHNPVEVTAFLTVRQLLIEADFVAALPGPIGRDDPRLVTLPVSLEPIGRSLGLTLASGRRLAPAVEAMISALQGAAAEFDGGDWTSVP